MFITAQNSIPGIQRLKGGVNLNLNFKIGERYDVEDPPTSILHIGFFGQFFQSKKLPEDTLKKYDCFFMQIFFLFFEIIEATYALQSYRG